MARNYIVIGEDERTYNGDEIIDLTTNRSNSLMLDEMSSDVCEATVVDETEYLETVSYGTKIRIFRDAALQDVFYLSKVTRIKKEQYKIEMTSFFGILEAEIFYGGYYTGESLQNVVESIIQTNGLDPTTTDHADVLSLIQYDPGVESLPVYGWIQVVNKREALHQVLFAKGISMKRASGGAIRFTLVYDTDPVPIPENDTYEDNDVRFLPNVSNIEVEEHTFTDDGNKEIEVLFENRYSTDLSKSYVAVFNTHTPVLRKIQTTLNVIYQNCNAAIVQGMGSISGYPSVHSTAVIKETIRENKGDTVSIKGCTLITMADSAYILDKIKTYYLSAKTEISADIVRTDQRTGNHVSIVNSFGERVSGFITEMKETYSEIVKANCKIVTGYNPLLPAFAEYTRSVVLHGSGGWTVPESVFHKDTPKIKVVLVGGGSGGNSGYAGERGGQGIPSGDGGRPGSGGPAGNGGAGGKIYTFDIENPSSILYFACGNGGSGGEKSTSDTSSNHGSEGTDTTLTDGDTTYTSANGERNDNGVTNFITGMQYGINHGISKIGKAFQYLAFGGTGGYQSTIPIPTFQLETFLFDTTTTPPSYELAKYSDRGGTGSSAIGRLYVSDYSYVEGPANGGTGGGSTAGIVGENGGDALGTESWGEWTAARGGKGGKGADASVTPPPTHIIKESGFLPWDDGGYGDGGFGGYGGGGGGAGGNTINHVKFVGGARGAGGYGGKGGNGGDGCIIIYY